MGTLAINPREKNYRESPALSVVRPGFFSFGSSVWPLAVCVELPGPQVNAATSAQMCRSETPGKARCALRSKAELLGARDVASLHALAIGSLPGTEEADPLPQSGERQRLWALAVTVLGKQLC